LATKARKSSSRRSALGAAVTSDTIPEPWSVPQAEPLPRWSRTRRSDLSRCHSPRRRHDKNALTAPRPVRFPVEARLFRDGMPIARCSGMESPYRTPELDVLQVQGRADTRCAPFTSACPRARPRRTWHERVALVFGWTLGVAVLVSAAFGL